MKYRIVEYTHCVNEINTENGRSRIEYVIERKTWLGGWKEITKKELNDTRISHKTYKDAEVYLMTNYMGHGECTKIGIEYKYEPYTYFV